MYDDSSDYQPTLFREEREAALNRFIGDHPLPEKNKAKRTRFWSVLGGTVMDVIENARHVGFIRLATKIGIVNLDTDEGIGAAMASGGASTRPKQL
jgi:hypothetical protein